MAHQHPASDDTERALDAVFGATPLMFVQEFLRGLKRKHKKVVIGATMSDAREALQAALASGLVSIQSVEQWLNAIEGWGKQHLYLSRVPRKPLNATHLLTEAGLRRFLAKRGHLSEAVPDTGAAAHSLSDISVDDELARLTWRVHGSDWERRAELDEVRELIDGEYEFRAYRRLLRRAASRALIRKTDGVLILLVDVPLGDEHDLLKLNITNVVNAVIAPLVSATVELAPIVRALDANALEGFGPRPTRSLDIGIEPTLSRFRAEGARIEFKSTRDTTGYNASAPVRHVRRAMQISNFVGESGKFRLSFEGEDRRQHDMVVSLSASENRTYLFSRMDEMEVLSLVDNLLAASPT